MTMRRDDLLSMTLQDLEGYSNRGTVKRAQKELEKLSAERDADQTLLSEDDAGNLAAHWPDGAITQLGANEAFPQGRCTCPSTTTCRHLITLVLAYQEMRAEAAESPVPVAWNPGDISDELMAKAYTPAQIRKANKWFQEGVLAELALSEKPLAIIETIGVAVRFLAPGDPRYVQSDGDEELTAVAAIIAILAFRRLPQGQTAGYVSTCPRPPVEPEALQSVGDLFVRLLQGGLSQLEPGLRDKLRRAARRLQAHDWLWPASHCERLVEQIDRYNRRDGSFSPSQAIRHMGEFLCRQRALASPTLPAPEVVVRGGGPKRARERTGKSRYIGLGCRMRVDHGGVFAEVFLQSVDTGALVILEKRQKTSKDEDAPLSYYQIAQRLYVLQHSIRDYGKGQVLTSGAKLSLDNRMTFGRQTALNPQSYQWSTLRQNLLMEDFDELLRRLASRLAGPFRSLKANENFYALKVAGVANPRFDTASQCVTADLVDAKGARMALAFPYSTRGAGGAEALLQLLRMHGSHISYVAGSVTEHTHGLMIEPVSVVYSVNQQAMMLQPYVDDSLPGTPVAHALPAENRFALARTALSRLLEQVDQLLCDILITGLRRASPGVQSQWRELTQQCDEIGLHRLSRIMSSAVDWRDDNAATNPSALLNLLIYLRLCK
ncbi:Transposase and inactivated derivatives [Hahella chejuensis KCTC 2396]|uniref:Transposase and inactivated derivatives n=1 Tax=Hahella chejuensis (strain KCTC 2396) TaxID=349521 RepID=Q2SH06_HAHCH|nr:hypothetical protein [Hahella chejuensis]ABC30068.1 Transposase and inactivated derivatives [Hahella chejuensis KCTC 2396]